MIFIKERFKREHFVLFLEKLRGFVIAVFERKNVREINPVLVFGGNGTQCFPHIFTARAFPRHEYVDMPHLLGRAMNIHSEENKNREHRFSHMNKVNKLRSKLAGQAFILPAGVLKGRNITTGRQIKAT